MGSGERLARLTGARLVLGGLLVAAVLVLAACGGGDETTTTTVDTGESGTTGATGVTGATGAAGQQSAADLPPIENVAGPTGYQNLIRGTFELLNAFWAKQVPSLGGTYSPPSKFIPYQHKQGEPDCGGKPVGVNNADFCSETNAIAWDDDWLLGFDEKVGDPAVSFVLAHEYGHLVQDRVGVYDKFRFDIERELNADCLAGAWFGTVNRDVATLTRRDYRELYTGVFDVADPRGLPWQNPQAHGTARERIGALDTGARGGAKACLRKLGPGFTR